MLLALAMCVPTRSLAAAQKAAVAAVTQQPEPKLARADGRMAPRVQVFWCCFLVIYLCFWSFSCGRADRLWRISDVYAHSSPVLLKPYGLAWLWYARLGGALRPLENAVLLAMGALALGLPRRALRRALSGFVGASWLFMHGYEHSVTGGSHTHVLPAICMMCLALPEKHALANIRWWNMFLLFSAGLSKLFNGDHHAWWAWMDGESMRFYFLNSRLAVPEPFWTMTLAHDWFAAAQCGGSVVFELSTCLLFWRPYRLAFPALGAAFHGVIWYTLGVNYLTSVIIQWTLVLDADDWTRLEAKARDALAALAGRAAAAAGAASAALPAPAPAVAFAGLRGPTLLTPLVLALTIATQLEYWPLTPIPMYSGYRPAAGYNTTHIANATYLDHLVNEMAPHVWARHWTDVVVRDAADANASYNLQFCARASLRARGVKDACLVPIDEAFDTENRVARNARPTEAMRLRARAGGGHVTSMRPGGWGRQKPIVVITQLGRERPDLPDHVYCEHPTLAPAEDFLYRQCAFLAAFPWADGRALSAELVVHLGTGDVRVGDAVDCARHREYGYRHDQVPPCVQTPHASRHYLRRARWLAARAARALGAADDEPAAQTCRSNQTALM